jgi:hypothetical protein
MDNFIDKIDCWDNLYPELREQYELHFFGQLNIQFWGLLQDRFHHQFFIQLREELEELDNE